MSIPLLSKDVAGILGVTPAMVRIYARTGKLHSVSTRSGTRLFDVDEVNQFKKDLKERRRERRDAKMFRAKPTKDEGGEPCQQP